jgi:hypothetical protein
VVVGDVVRGGRKKPGQILKACRLGIRGADLLLASKKEVAGVCEVVGMDARLRHAHGTCKGASVQVQSAGQVLQCRVILGSNDVMAGRAVVCWQSCDLKVGKPCLP